MLVRTPSHFELGLMRRAPARAPMAKIQFRTDAPDHTVDYRAKITSGMREENLLRHEPHAHPPNLHLPPTHRHHALTGPSQPSRRQQNRKNIGQAYRRIVLLAVLREVLLEHGAHALHGGGRHAKLRGELVGHAGAVRAAEELMGEKM